MAMYLAKMLTQRSLPDIGRRFGGRDHTTILHAVRKVEQRRAVDTKFSATIDAIMELLPELRQAREEME